MLSSDKSLLARVYFVIERFNMSNQIHDVQNMINTEITHSVVSKGHVVASCQTPAGLLY